MIIAQNWPKTAKSLRSPLTPVINIQQGINCVYCGVDPEYSLDDENWEPKTSNNTETNDNWVHVPLHTISQRTTIKITTANIY